MIEHVLNVTGHSSLQYVGLSMGTTGFMVAANEHPEFMSSRVAWLPDGYSQIFRSYVFGPSGFWTMAPLRSAAKFDPFLSLNCAPRPSTLAQSKERKGSNFAIWQPCRVKMAHLTAPVAYVAHMRSPLVVLLPFSRLIEV